MEETTINIGGGSDVEAGIEFIYHMREHLIDISVATAFAIAIYAVVLFIKRKLTHCKCEHCGCDKLCH